ncbi:MAG: hypothetical protein FJ197_08075 [Gammaproteobacteria bacterium]|nr:hypothetical protein [Gammaproteobacteria bacterium]
MLSVFARVLVLSAWLPFAAGCSMFLDEAPGMPIVKVYNNTGRDVLIDNEEVDAGDVGTLPFPKNPQQPMTVFVGGCVWTYLLGGEAEAFRTMDWILRAAYRVQLEPDGRLYGIASGLRPPADAGKLAQPAGFPLAPATGSSCRP